MIITVNISSPFFRSTDDGCLDWAGCPSRALTALQFRVLAYLVKYAGRVVSADELLRQIWGTWPASRRGRDAVRKLVDRLREKMEPDPGRPRYILTMWGRGYYVPAEVRRELLARRN
jgi:DNA-binding response OmpR family regulator